MSKTNKSKSGSRSSRSRSASRSRSRSFSKSRSRSRSVSRSRKRRLSSRSRSRSYSPAHNRERNHPRVYQNRDFRGHNRGYRRPYYFRGRNRGFYPWGQYNRGGYGNYRSNWQNYRQAYSPRRGRSRSRSPKRRSPSPRSRSHSRNSDKSSSDRSRRSSSSRSSSNHSRVESSKRKSAKEKKSSSKDSRPSQSAGDNQGEEAKEQTFSGGTSQDTKASESSKPWADATTYSAGSASRASAVSELSPRERSPALKSPLQSVVVRRRSPRPSPVPKPSPPLSSTSQMGSSLQSGSGYQAGSHQGQFDHGSGSLSPSKKSPVGKSPPATGSTYGSSQKEEAASGGAAYTKRQNTYRYLDEQKTENGKDKEQKQSNTDKEKMKEKGSFSDTGLSDSKIKSDLFAPKTDSEKPFRGSQSPKRYKLRDDFEKKMADFHKEDMDDQDKDKAKGRKESEFDDEPKFMSKVIAGANKNQEDEKSGKWEVYAPSGKEKQRKTEELEEESFSERSKKEDRGGLKRTESGHRGFVPEKNFRVTAYKAVQEKSSSPPPRKTSESREKLGAKGDFSTGKSSFSITREAQVNVRMDSFDEDLARPSGLLAQERKLCRDLVHSNKKEQEFRSIFQHIQSAQSQRSPSELFAQHIVTIVHHVKEHHFGSSGMTLHERFTKYLKRGTEQEAAKNKKSPEIHRRIDISPSTFRKHGLAHDEMKSPREPGYKAEGKYKDDPVDLRLDIERRKKHKERDLKRGKSRESVDSRDSSHSRERSAEKTEKTHKGSKKQKKHRRTRDRSRSSSSSSQSSHSYKAEEYTEETEEREESTTGFDKSRLGTKDFVGPNERGGRARGTFQFRARGRGWGRGNYSGNNNNSSNNDFQKRSREEEWDPEYTPKSKKYYLHDDREGEGSEKWGGRGRGRGAFPRGRGRFMFRKSSTSPKWAHDKFSGEEGEIEDDESGTENREEKDNLQPTTE
ncbi:Thyroid hormone receptor-associated protein 3 [Myotis brandtii]|uniref:Thyroid hormone receptor-associated protein 3 n=2 Tax=Myotis TaxID=9434 RepID=S7PLW6_MYOBR|nr:Thyroid hormone receptor-associated protein 3 [Myotis brandtii]